MPRKMSRVQKDNQVHAAKIGKILGISRKQAWRLLRAGIIQRAIKNVETGMWSAPLSEVEALRLARALSRDGRVKKPIPF